MKPTEEDKTRYVRAKFLEMEQMIERTEERSKIMKERWTNPEYRDKELERRRDPEARARQSRIMKEKWKVPEFRARMIASMRKHAQV